jgi:hypothetical protein
MHSQGEAAGECSFQQAHDKDKVSMLHRLHHRKCRFVCICSNDSCLFEGTQAPACTTHHHSARHRFALAHSLTHSMARMLHSDTVCSTAVIHSDTVCYCCDSCDAF